MGWIANIKGWFSGMINGLFGREIEKILNITIATTQEMRDAQELWHLMDIGQAPWNNSDVPSLMITNQLNRYISNLVTLKSAHEVTGDSPRAQYLNQQLQTFCDELQQIVQKGCAGGTLVFKPHITPNNQIHVAVIENNMYLPLGYNEKKELIDAIFFSFLAQNNIYYTLIERITYDETQKALTYEYKAFYSNDEEKLGKELTSFAMIEEWAHLESYTLYDIDFNWITEFKMPQVNIIEQNSPEGSALCANAVDNIRKADMLEELTEHEFHAGRLKQNITSDMLKRDEHGNYIVDKDIFVVLEGTGIPGKELIQTYNPPPRYEAYRSRLNDIKRNIEDNIGLSRGTISDVQQQAMTATEVEATRENTKGLVDSIQTNMGILLTNLVKIFDDMADRYMLALSGHWDFQLFWNISVLVTESEKQAKFIAELNTYILLKVNQIITDAELRAFFKENSDSFSKLTPQMIKDALEGLPEAFDENTGEE